MAAVVAEGGFVVTAGQVADVNVMQARFFADVIRAGEDIDPGGSNVGGFVLRMESADVPGDVRAEILGDKLGQLCKFLVGIVQARDHHNGCTAGMAGKGRCTRLVGAHTKVA